MEDVNTMETLLFLFSSLVQLSCVTLHSGDTAVHCKLGKQSKKSLLFQLETWSGMVK